MSVCHTDLQRTFSDCYSFKYTSKDGNLWGGNVGEQVCVLFVLHYVLFFQVEEHELFLVQEYAIWISWQIFKLSNSGKHTYKYTYCFSVLMSLWWLLIVLFFLLCDCVLQVNLPTCDIPPPSTSLFVPAQCSRTHYPGAWLLLTHPSSDMTLGASHSLACSKADVQCYRMCA